MKRQIFISCGQKQKKTSNTLSLKNLYLNYGLLAVASSFKKNGDDVYVYQADYKSPIDFYNFLDCSEDLSRIKTLFLSIYTYYTLEWAIDFCKIISSSHPHIQLIAGGKWVITSVDEIKKLQSLIPSISVFVPGNFTYSPFEFSNVTQSSILKNYNQRNLKEETNDFLCIDALHNYSDYTPSIEISHGCGLGCEFCVDKDLKRTVDKSPISIMSEINKLENLYNCNDFKVYYEAPHFKPTVEWCEMHCNAYLQNSKKYHWRCQTRVDTLDEQKLTFLYQSGLRVLDLGLESASPVQLMKMNKTKKPDKYLENAEKLLINCKNIGIWCKVNIMFYKDETYDTLNETLHWVIAHKELIKGISAYPFVTYSLDSFGLKKHDSLGIRQESLSSYLSFADAEVEARKISRIVMTYKDYFDLKSFGYFPRTYSYYDFLIDVDMFKDNWNEMPFNIDEIEFRTELQKECAIKKDILKTSTITTNL